MNILFVSSAAHFGGTERWMSMAVKALEQRGHKVWVACPDLPHASQFTSSEKLLFAVPRSMLDAQGRTRLSAAMADLKVDVVIPVSQRMYFVCGRLARRHNIPMVLRLGIVRFPWRPVIDWFGYGIWPSAIIVNTKSIERVLSRAPFVDRDKIHVIYNGIDQAIPRPEPRQDRRFVITFAGTVSWRKGTGHLITAMSLIPADARRRVVLQIAGAGPGLEHYRARVKKLGLQDCVSFCGHVDNPAGLLQHSDLFALLSSQEGISNSLLEAMNLAVPCYTTLVGGHGEFIQDKVNAYVARTRNPKAVAQDLISIINDPRRVEVGLNGQQTAREKFNSLAMGNALDSLLQAVVNKAEAK